VLVARQGGTPTPRANARVLRRLATSLDGLGVVLAGASRSYAWIVSAAGIKLWRCLPANELEPLVRAHQATIANALAGPLASTDTAGDKLYRLLIEPVAKWIPSNASVIIVPDGRSWSELRDAACKRATRHYWIEDVEIQVAPSLASLALGRAKHRGPRSLLAIGNPTPRPPESLPSATRRRNDVGRAAFQR